LYLGYAFELNVERGPQARHLVNHILLKAIVPPTTKSSLIDQAFGLRHGASHLWSRHRPERGLAL
jgi:hypothetical protein